MKQFLSLLLLLLVPIGVADARDLTIEDAEQLAREYSMQLKRAHLQTASATSRMRIAQAERYPTLAVTGRANYIDNLPSFTIDLPVGDPMVRELGAKENYQGDITLSVPLYTGGRIGSGVEAGRALVAVQEALVEATLDQVTLQARTAYLRVDRADQLIATAEAALGRAQITAQDVQSMFEAGAADSVALLEARLGVNEASLAVDEYRSLRQQEAITLAILLGLDPTEEIRLTSGFSTPVLPRTPTETIDRPELAAAAARIEQLHAAIGGARADYLPTISLFGGYSVGKPNRDMFNADWDDYFTVGARAGWSFNLGNRTGNEVALAEYDLAMARQAELRTKDDLTREAALAFAQWQLTARRYFTSEERLEIAAANYRLAQSQHDAGALPTNRLLEIERNLSRAEAALAVTLVDYHLAHARYSYASGTDSF